MPLWRSRINKMAVLERLPLFAGLSGKELERIGRLVEEIEVPAGRQLASTGDAGRELFIIVDGRAVVTTARGRVIRLRPGDFFGEMSLIDGEPRSADVTAATPMRLLAIGYREFWQMLDESLPIVRKIMRALCQRLRRTERSALA